MVDRLVRFLGLIFLSLKLAITYQHGFVLLLCAVTKTVQYLYRQWEYLL
jgi:hypothetical protein